MSDVQKQSPLHRTAFSFLAIAVVCAIFADIEITTVNPWTELGRMALGIVTPDFLATDDFGMAMLYTLSFALLGVTFGNIIGFGLALVFFSRTVRIGCAFIRAIHELFWALLFLQIFGLSPLTGILAIGIPYAGIIAKVYAEILEEGDQGPLLTLPNSVSRASAFVFVQLPGAWAHFKTYSMYRLECGLRSSAVLGFVGLPTLGFHLESAFSQGNYSEAAALLFAFFAVIATMRLWMHKRMLPVYLIGAAAALPWGLTFTWDNIVRFLTRDIVPYPLRAEGDGDTMAALGDWLHLLLVDQALPGTIATIQLTMVALIATGLLTMVMFPLISPLLLRAKARMLGHLTLVVIRSTPEYILAFVLLQLWGPSMLPAIIALALHNGAIIGHLIGRFTETMNLRIDAARGVNLYLYEIVPRIYRSILALLFYRWEVILRETAILGILGIATLGYYIDSAFAELRFDRALILILVTALLNICVDAISRSIRAKLRLQTSLEHT
jgi:phosphonate transport system permease protein